MSAAIRWDAGRPGVTNTVRAALALIGGLAVLGVAFAIYEPPTSTHADAKPFPHGDPAADMGRPPPLPVRWREPEAAPRTVRPLVSSVRVVSLAGLFKTSTGLCTQKRSKRDASAARASTQTVRAQDTSATRFDVTSIAAFLRASHTSQKPGTPMVLAVPMLDADGIADVSPAPLPAAVPVRTQVAATKDASNDPSLAFATALGQIKTAAHAGVMNGQPAGSLNIGLTHGPIVIDATGMSEVTNLSEPGVFRKTFKLSTRASIPLD